MLFRFCLYGFLKNQQYYDPFIILAFREKGLSFAMIGLLIGFREICINILEVPTGAVADVIGRRRAMIFSFLAYIVAFLTFGFSSSTWMLFAAMLFFSTGEAFRTGTHKAIIFDWLARENRSGEKTRIYGQTRAWSKVGSAASVIIAAILVFTLRKYSYIFFFSILPYTVNILNFLSYPAYLDGPRKGKFSFSEVALTLWDTLRDSLRSRPLRRLFIEAAGFEGCHKVCKDYLQPLLKATALALPVLAGIDDRRRVAVLVGAVYLVLYLLSSFASRHADTLVKRTGSEERGARCLWVMNTMAFVFLSAGFLAGVPAVAIAAFAALTIIQNFWRPILISRVASNADNARMATILSIESQAKSLFAAILAPLLGLAVDLMPKITVTFARLTGIDSADLTDWRFLPVGLLGLAVCLIMLTGARSEISNRYRRPGANR